MKKLKVIRYRRPSQDGILIIQKGKIFIFTMCGPNMYEWDETHATKREKAYLRACLVARKWLI